MNMTKYITAFFLAGIFVFTSCDKVENAYPEPETELDVSLYPGNWSDYMENEYPEFPNLSSQAQNVLLEEYTGHRCNNCPNAAIVANDLAANNPDRVFVAAIHASPGGMSSFQQFDPNASSFYTNHTNDEGLSYGEYFQNGFNFFGNPQGTVNKQVVDNKMFDFSGTWATRTTNLLANTDVKIRMQSVFNYYETTNGGYLHVQLEKTNNLSVPINTVVYVVQDTLTDWQVMPNNSYNPEYIHKNKHLGSIDNRPFGRLAFGSSSASGEQIILDYAYKLPNILDPENLHFLIYAYNTETYEIYQVIKQRIIL
jgi:hypothetical protein